MSDIAPQAVDFDTARKQQLTRVQKNNHPALNQSKKPLSLEEEQTLLAEHFENNPVATKRLITECTSIIHTVLKKFLHYRPEIKPEINSLLVEGALLESRLIREITPAELSGSTLKQYLTKHLKRYFKDSLRTKGYKSPSDFVVLLQGNQRKTKQFQHPITSGVGKCISHKQASALLITYFQTRNQETRDKLILGYIPYIRHLVGRYLYHWPVTRFLIDDLVSIGLVTLTQLITNLVPGDLKGRTLLKTIALRVQFAMAVFINDTRAITTLSFMTNRRLIEYDATPRYGYAVASLDSFCLEDQHQYVDPNLEYVDVVDALEAVKSPDSTFINEENWGLGDSELAEQNSVARTTIRWRREKLYDAYCKLTDDLN